MGARNFQGRGRPSTPLLLRMRVVIWGHFTMAAAGVSTAQEFESALSGMPGRLRLSGGLWGRYLRGDVLPQGSTAREGQSLVLRIDRALPGTAATFYHPVWELLDFKKLLGPDQLRELYLQMGREVWEGMVDLRPGDRPVLRSDVFHFWRRRKLEHGHSQKIRSMSMLDGIASSLIEARMAYFAQDRMDVLNSMTEADIHLMRAKDDVTLFGTLRMQTVVLLLKGIWLQEMGRLAVDPPALDEVEQVVRDMLSEETDKWEEACDNHLATLPRHMAVQFRRWRRSVVDY